MLRTNISFPERWMQKWEWLVITDYFKFRFLRNHSLWAIEFVNRHWWNATKRSQVQYGESFPSHKCAQWFYISSGSSDDEIKWSVKNKTIQRKQWGKPKVKSEWANKVSEIIDNGQGFNCRNEDLGMQFRVALFNLCLLFICVPWQIFYLGMQFRVAMPRSAMAKFTWNNNFFMIILHSSWSLLSKR